MAHTRAVNAYTKLASRQVNPGFSVAGLRPDASLTLDPFLSIDAFHMSQATFPPHPHAGFSAVTYMLPESPGAFTNRGSRGIAGGLRRALCTGHRPAAA
jgi:redox-sensitive bicupin YhaK (pirin superfamily)